MYMTVYDGKGLFEVYDGKGLFEVHDGKGEEDGLPREPVIPILKQNPCTATSSMHSKAVALLKHDV